MNPLQLKKIITNILEEHKATDISAFDVRKITDISDYLIICSATSSRHIKALSDHVIEHVKKRGIKPIGQEGRKGEYGWALIDLGDIVVHIMTPAIREFYNLEKLWDVVPAVKKTKKSTKPVKKVVKKKASKTTKKIKVSKLSVSKPKKKMSKSKK